jgi:hypothetical protein
VLTELDLAIVEWIARVGAAGARDVQVAMRLSRTHAYSPLARCVESGVLAHVRVLHGAPGLYLPTRSGLDRLRPEQRRLSVFLWVRPGPCC